MLWNQDLNQFERKNLPVSRLSRNEAISASLVLRMRMNNEISTAQLSFSTLQAALSIKGGSLGLDWS